jgi:hypothetical protein
VGLVGGRGSSIAGFGRGRVLRLPFCVFGGRKDDSV